MANSLGPVIATPEERDDDPTTDFRDEVSEFIGQHLKGVSTEVETYEACIVTVSKKNIVGAIFQYSGIDMFIVCMYLCTMIVLFHMHVVDVSLLMQYTSTQDPILDRHPSYDNIILGMGLSGIYIL